MQELTIRQCSASAPCPNNDVLVRNDMASSTRPIGVDLFAGAGGMTLGFEQAGFDVLAAVELDPIHCAAHEYNFPFWTVFCHSAAEISGADIRRGSTIGDREIAVVFGGPPCQGCSTMGKRALDDPRNDLMRHFMRLVLELQPRFFAMENVRGLTLGKHRQILSELLECFAERGYRAHYRVLNAAHFGVPQDRQRLFLIGCREGETLPIHPSPRTRPIAPLYRAEATGDHLPIGPSVEDAIGDLPPIEDAAVLFERDWIEIDRYTSPSDYSARLRGLSRDPQDYAYRRDYNPDLLTCSNRTRHSPKTVARFANTPLGTVDRISRFLKLDPDGLCNTLRAGTPSSRGAFTSPRPIHPFLPRCITVREAARLHSYPDWFRFHGTKWHGFRQIGNSVPPLLARAVANSVLEAAQLQPKRPRKIQPLGDLNLLQWTMSAAARHYNVSSRTIAPRQKLEPPAPALTTASGSAIGSSR